MPRANPMRGEAILGDKLIRMNFEAWIAFEEKTGRKLPDHVADLGIGLGAGDLADWIGAFLAEELPRPDVIALISGVGHPEAMAALNKAAESYFGPLAAGDSRNPPKAA